MHTRTRAARGDLLPCLAPLVKRAIICVCRAFRSMDSRICAPFGRVFAPFWYENGYTLYPIWSGMGYDFRGNYGSV